VEDALEEDETIPEPRSIEEITNDPDVREELAVGGVIASVPLVMDSGRLAKANISLDAGLLQVLDETARTHRLTRSAFIASAIREKIAAGQAADSAFPAIVRAFDVASRAEENKPADAYMAIDELIANIARGTHIVQAGRYGRPLIDPLSRPIDWTAYVDLQRPNAKSVERYVLGKRREHVIEYKGYRMSVTKERSGYIVCTERIDGRPIRSQLSIGDRVHDPNYPDAISALVAAKAAIDSRTVE
jgi:hypothetical protein